MIARKVITESRSSRQLFNHATVKTMSHSPLISVVIPTHNRPELLAEALQSVAEQTLTDWEAIVVDDASQPAVDPTQILQTYGPKVKVLRHELARGGSASKNTGIQAASGRYVAFLDDDDIYDPKYLETAVATLEQHPKLTTLFMSVVWFGPNSKWTTHYYSEAMGKILAELSGTLAGDNLLLFEDEKLFNALLNRIPMAFQRPVLKRLDLLDIGLYQEDCLLWDCEWALRAALKGSCGLLTTALYRQRAAGQGYSSQPRRRLDHGLSNMQIKNTLLTILPADSPLRAATKRAAIDTSLGVSWEYMNQRQGLLAMQTALATFRHGVSWQQLKMLARALLIWIGGRFLKPHNDE